MNFDEGCPYLTENGICSASVREYGRDLRFDNSCDHFGSFRSCNLYDAEETRLRREMSKGTPEGVSTGDQR